MQELFPHHQPIKNVSFVALDFETVTPSGRPPEPLELAAIRIAPGFSVDQSFRTSWLIQPPAGAPITPFDTRQTGIGPQDVKHAPDAVTVLQEFDSRLQHETVVLIAHNAPYEASILQRFKHACPHAASLPMIDTILFAKQIVPHLTNYKLDTVAQHFAIRIPANRHRALPDVELTIEIFLRLIHLRLEQHPDTTITALLHLAGMKRKQEQDETTQMTLF